MTVDVLMPWRPGEPHREAAQRFVADHYRSMDLEVIEADDGGEPFSRGGSINLAAEKSSADVFLIVDADTVVERAQALRAADEACEAPGMVIAHDEWLHINPRGSAMLLADKDPWSLDWRPYVDFSLPATVSSAVAVSRSTWVAVGGFPEQFRGWGFEDVAFDIMCKTFAGPTRRVPGAAWHLYHPGDQIRPTENQELIGAYLAAEGDPERLREVIGR